MSKKTTKEAVYDAITELHSLEQIVTRETLSDQLDLPLSVIDDRLKTLANDGTIMRVQRGVYVPIVQHPPARTISHTELPDGTVILDVGDDVIKLTPREARVIATMLGARAIQASQINLADQVGLLAAELTARVRMLERKEAEKEDFAV